MPRFDYKKFGVSQGLLTTFMRCRKEAELWCQKLEPMRTGQGLQFGSIAHMVLEDVYGRGLKVPPSRSVVLGALEKALEGYREERGNRLGAEEEDFMELNAAILEAVLPHYFTFHRKDFQTVNWAELEEKFRVPSPVPGIDMVGRRDGAFWLGKKLWLRENKTKARVEEDTLTETLAFDFQNAYYFYGLIKKYKVFPEGVLYDIIRRPGERLKQGESFKAYSRRIEARVVADPKYYFIRYEISIPKSEHKRFVEELTVIMKEFVKWADGEMPTYRNTSACIQRWGPCKFLPICANGEYSFYRKRKDVYPELVR